MNAGIIVAAGRSPTSTQQVDHSFLSLGTKPVLAYSMQAFEKCPDIDVVIVVARKDRVEAAYAVADMFGCAKVHKVVAGGAQRVASLIAGLEEMNEEIRIVVTHDATRPCVTPEQISLTIKSAKRYGTGITAARAEDAVKQVDKGQVVKKSLDRSKLWITNSPQGFKIEVLRDGLNEAKRKGVTIGDDSEAAELVSKEVRLVPSSMPNIRIETADDLSLAGALLRL